MAAKVFMSYSHRDEELRDQLEVQLAMLKRQGLIDVWHDRRLLAGDHLDWTISKELDEADIVLLLISPDFLASDYCYKIEKGRALERHNEGSARLISVILRPCDWTYTDLAQYLVTPTDDKAITRWTDRDEAFLDVARSIRRAIEEIGISDALDKHIHIETQETAPNLIPPLPRSSNMRLKKQFSDADRDRFLMASFEYMCKFFEGSLAELQARNSGYETRHRVLHANAFTATIYKGGSKAAACTIKLGSGIMGNGIAFAFGDDVSLDTFNEELTIGYDDQKQYLQPLGSRLNQIQNAMRVANATADRKFLASLS